MAEPVPVRVKISHEFIDALSGLAADWSETGTVTVPDVLTVIRVLLGSLEIDEPEHG